jgi:type II secretory pathway component PulJ
MISQLVVETSEQLAAYRRYEKDKNIKQKLEATQKRLAELRRAIATFAHDYRLVADILEPEKRQYIHDAGKGYLAQLTDSQHDFVEQQQSNQAASLNSIILSLNHLRSELHAAWRVHAEAQTKPRRELYNLVSSLPELSGSRAQMDSLFQRLNTYAESFPHSRGDRENFQTQLERVDHYLEEIPVSATVRDFLEQVRMQQFTVADLNEEILAWCREGDRGRVFKITV